MKIENRKALFDYTIVDRLEAGVALTGGEVKSLRGGHGKLEGSFVKIVGGEAKLVNAEIYPYQAANEPAYDSRRTRKLLLHRKELIALQSKMDSQKLTLVPLAWYTTGHLWKLEIGLARGKRQYEKREKIKREDQKRELERQFRVKVK